MEQGTFWRFLAVPVAMVIATMVWVVDMEEVSRYLSGGPDAAVALRLIPLWIIVKWMWRVPEGEAEPAPAPAHMRAMSGLARVRYLIAKRQTV